jgi:hypothetical protein
MRMPGNAVPDAKKRRIGMSIVPRPPRLTLYQALI